MNFFLDAVSYRRHAEERPQGASRSTRTRRRRPSIVLATILGLLVAGCAARDDRSGDRPGGFYVGGGGGVTRP